MRTNCGVWGCPWLLLACVGASLQAPVSYDGNGAGSSTNCLGHERLACSPSLADRGQSGSNSSVIPVVDYSPLQRQHRETNSNATTELSQNTPPEPMISETLRNIKQEVGFLAAGINKLKKSIFSIRMSVLEMENRLPSVSAHKDSLSFGASKNKTGDGDSDSSHDRLSHPSFMDMNDTASMPASPSVLHDLLEPPNEKSSSGNTSSHFPVPQNDDLLSSQNKTKGYNKPSAVDKLRDIPTADTDTDYDTPYGYVTEEEETKNEAQPFKPHEALAKHMTTKPDFSHSSTDSPDDTVALGVEDFAYRPPPRFYAHSSQQSSMIYDTTANPTLASSDSSLLPLNQSSTFSTQPSLQERQIPRHKASSNVASNSSFMFTMSSNSTFPATTFSSTSITSETTTIPTISSKSPPVRGETIAMDKTEDEELATLLSEDTSDNADLKYLIDNDNNPTVTELQTASTPREDHFTSDSFTEMDSTLNSTRTNADRFDGKYSDLGDLRTRKPVSSEKTTTTNTITSSNLSTKMDSKDKDLNTTPKEFMSEVLDNTMTANEEMVTTPSYVESSSPKELPTESLENMKTGTKDIETTPSHVVSSTTNELPSESLEVTKMATTGEITTPAQDQNSILVELEGIQTRPERIGVLDRKPEENVHGHKAVLVTFLVIGLALVLLVVGVVLRCQACRMENRRNGRTVHRPANYTARRGSNGQNLWM